MKKLFLLSLLALAFSGAAQAQIFLTTDTGSVEEYNSLTGAFIQNISPAGATYIDNVYVAGTTLFIAAAGNNDVYQYGISTGVLNSTVISTASSYPYGMALVGTTLYVTTGANGTGDSLISYNITTGSKIATLATGLSNPWGIALSGSDIFVAQSAANEISEYTTSGTLVNAAFVTGVTKPLGVTIYNGVMYVTASGTVSTYNATTGAVINSSFITGLTNPIAIEESDGDLFIDEYGSGSVGVYSATTGAVINADLVSGAGSINGMALATGALGPQLALAAPEPRAWVFGLGMLVGFFCLYRWYARSADDLPSSLGCA